MSRFKYIGRKRACPVCGGDRHDCRELDKGDTTLYFCRTENPSLDYEFQKFDKNGFSIYIEKAVLNSQDQKRREEHRRQWQAEKEARLRAEKERKAKSLSESERDLEIRKLLNQLPLLPHHRADLERRGLSAEQIKSGLFSSVEQWQKLSEPISHRLAGVAINGRSLITQSGYICPIFNESKLIIGWQLRADDSNNGGKYRWATSNTRKRPDGPTSHLQNGELPLTIHKSGNDDNLRLAEGILKPYVAHSLRGQTYIGAAGGNFANSPQQLKKYIDDVQPQKIILCPDAGSRVNKNVLRQYRAIANFLKSWNLTLWVEDWGQSDDKGSCDVDEISPNTETKIIPFSEWDIDRHREKLWRNPVTNLNIKGTAISFGKTINELLSGQKTVTRRVWKDSHAQKFINDWEAKPGEFIYPALTKSYRAGGRQIGCIRLTHKPYQEKLADMPDSDLAAEGFPQLSKQQFIEKFFDGNDQQLVWVIRFELISKQDQTAAEKKASEAERITQWLKQRAEELKTWWRKTRKFTPTITQNQKYVKFPEKIPDGCILLVKCALGGGKTYQLEQSFKPPYIDKKNNIYEVPGQFYFEGAIMIGARNGLLLQNANRLGFKHLQNDQCFSELHEKKSQIALCTDSLPHYLDPKWFDGKILILDEMMETIKHLLTSSTHRKNRAECLRLWGECLKRCKTIICLDGNLADWVIDEYILKFTGYRKVIKLENQYKGDRAPVEILVGTPTNKSKLPENINKSLKDKGLNSRDISPYISRILASHCPAIVTDSQKAAEALEIILKMFGKSGLRVDSKTVADKNHPAKAFLKAPDNWIKTNLPDFIILSPSAQSGIDISIRDYFSDVFALFFGVLGTDSMMQMPARIRDPKAHWHIACPESARKSGENFNSPVVSEVKEAIENYLLQDAASISKQLPQILKHLEGLIKQGLKDNPHHDAYATLKAKDNYEKANLRDCLVEALTEAGHEVKFVELQHDDDGAFLLKDAKEEVLRSEARDIFTARDIDELEAQEIGAKFEATWSERCQLLKFSYKSRLPGIENSTVWSEELIYLFRKHRDFINQSELHYFLYNPEHLQEQQEELWGYIALGGMKFLADVRSRNLKIKALLKLNIKQFLESDKLWNCHDPELKQMLTTARRSKKLSAALGIVPSKHPIHYLRRVVELMGHTLVCKKTNSDRFYRVVAQKSLKNVALDLDEVRMTLLKCLEKKYNPTTPPEQKSSKWDEALSAFSLAHQKSSEPLDIDEATPVAELPNVLKDKKGVATANQLDLYQPPPDTPLGDLTVYQEELPDFAENLEILIGLPPIQQPDLTPIEAFKYKVQTFGWNVIKEAAKLSEALASKVIGFVEQLIDSGEWHFAPG